MDSKVLPFRKGGDDLRWDVIERLARGYAVGFLDDAEIEEVKALSDKERQALQWQMECGDARLRHLFNAMQEEGVETLATWGESKD